MKGLPSKGSTGLRLKGGGPDFGLGSRAGTYGRERRWTPKEPDH